MLAKAWTILFTAMMIALCAAGESIAQAPAAAPATVMIAQGTPAAKPTTPVPVRRKLAAPLQRLQSLDNPPAAEFFADPGLEGIYARLRKTEPKLTAGLAFYVPYENRQTTADKSKFNLRQIVVKFVEGSSVRLRKGRLEVSTEPQAVDTQKRLGRRGLEPGNITNDIAYFEKLVQSVGGTVDRAAPQIDELDLMRLRQQAEGRWRIEQPELNLFYFVHLPVLDPEVLQKLLQSLQGLKSIETAYFQPIPFDAADIPPQTLIDVTPSQGYFRPASSGGIDVDFARLFSGGRGNAIRIADIEAGWNVGHEDLPRMSFGFGVNWGGDHGTAVLGQIAAEENGFGANGIAPNAVIGWSSVTNLNPFGPIYFYSVANALLMTGNVLQPGDIALIEQQFMALNEGFICAPATDPCGDCSIPDWRAVEEYPYEHAVISLLTGAGVIVVEAAGNGRMPVTPASSSDSGAIVVGASQPNRTPMCWSNFGPRVNVSSWGMSIGTLGYGGFLGTSGIVADPTLRANGGDFNQWYTSLFGGTSGASPIVVGAAAIVQSTHVAAGLPRLTPLEMRTLLAATGTPQAAGSTPNIGPQPDLRAAIASYIPDTARFISQSAAPSASVAPSATFNMTATFANSGGVAWTGSHTLSIAPSFQSGVQEFTGSSFQLGVGATPVNPGDQVARQFQVRAPAQPGTYNLAFILRNGAAQLLASSPSQQVVVAPPGSAVDNGVVTITSAPGSMRNGDAGTVTATARNTGSTTWMPGNYVVRVQRAMRISTPQQSVGLAAAVAPGGSFNFTVGISCNGQGQGWVSLQMGGIQGAFGQSDARTIVCQP